MFLFVSKKLLNTTSQKNFLRIRNQNLLRNLFFHNVSGNSKKLFNNFIKHNVVNSRSNLKSKESIFSSYLTLFVRRSRLAAKDVGKKSGPELKKVKIDKSSIRRLLSLAKPEKYKIAVAMIFLIISSSVTMVVPFGIGKLIDFLQTGDKETMQENLKMIALTMTLVFIIGALANFGRVYMIQSTGQRIVMRMRKNLFASIMNQEMAFFDRNKTGELINRLSSDTEVIGQSISQNLSDGLRSTIQVITGVGMMFYLSPYLAIVGLSVVPPVAIFAVGFGRYIKKISKQVQDVLAGANDLAQEKLSNIRTIRAFGQEEKETTGYLKKAANILEMKYREAMASGTFFAINGFSGNAIILTVFYFGGSSIAHGVITIGDLTSFLMYSAWVGISMSGLSSFYSELMKGVGASARTFEIMDRIPLIPIIAQTSDNLLTKEMLRNDIVFKNVTFAYPTRPEQTILKNLNLVIPGGKVLAVCGPSGSGKSTLASLILRYYDPIEGQVLVGDKDIRTLSQENLRSHIGTVPQEPVLFSMSIKDNIAYGSNNPEKVTFEKIKEVTEQANAYSFIDQFPDKFDTIVGERGANLSGGQKQRIAISRAILRDPKILLLDEATSALDASSEFLVQEALEKIMKKRTVIVIAHRLSTIKNADYIAVLDKGTVVELGTYNELMLKENGQFKELVERQTVENDVTNETH